MKANDKTEIPAADTSSHLLVSVIKILLIEDNPADVRLIREMLKDSNSGRFEITPAPTLKQGKELLKQDSFDVVLLDLGLPDSQGLGSLTTLVQQIPDTAIVVLTGLVDEEVGIHALKQGAQDYLIKGQVDGLLLTRSMRYAIERKYGEVSLRKVNCALKTLSACNEVLVRASVEDDLLNEICMTLIETGGYQMAWVTLADPDSIDQDLKIAARGHNYSNPQLASWIGTDTNRQLVKRVLQTGELYVSQDSKMQSDDQSWCIQAQNYGCFSVCMLPLINDKKTLGVLTICADQVNAFDEEEVQLLNELASDLTYGVVTLRMRAERNKTQQELRLSYEKLKRVLEETVQSLASALGKRDLYTAGHQQRVTQLACAIAEVMGFGKMQIDGIRIAGLLHDIGKIAIPAEILTKPNRLTAAEFNLIKSHAQLGFEILKDIEFPWPVAEIVLQHHERLDGSGYPQGLKDGEILLEAKILAVADVVEAMSSYRPYRPARGIEITLDEISQNRGKLYDPDVVDTCLKLFRERGFAFEYHDRHNG
jgi:putative nucleotidyltransferase with HDIG domain